MQITTACPQCGKTYEVDGEYEGAEVQCENCGRQFTVARIAKDSGNRSGENRPKTSFAGIWLLFFAIQGIGYLLSVFINMGIDAYMISFMVDASIVFDILEMTITFVLTAAASYLAFNKVVAKKDGQTA